MDSTKRAARSGGLAIAVGLGVAIACPGVALAEPSTSSASPSADSSPPASAPASETPPDSADDIADSPEEDSATDTEKTDDTTESETAESDTTESDTTESETAESETAESEENYEGDVPVSDASAPSAGEPATAPESGTAEESAVSEIPAIEPIAPHRSDDVLPVQSAVVIPSAAIARDAGPVQAESTEPAQEPEPEARIETASPQMVSTATTAQSTFVEPQPVPEQALAPSPVPSTGLMSRLLGWVGLSPSLGTAPAAPLQLPGLVGWIALAWHEVRRSLFNSSPTTAWNPEENSQSLDGVITGDLHADDADGDPLKFTVTDGPDGGAVVINPDGTFVYTPSAGLAFTGGTDEFTVKVRDQGFHLHGLFSALLKPDFGHATVETVEMTIDPVTNIVTATIEVGENPRWVAVSPDGTRVFVTNEADENVSVIDTATNTVIATIAVGDEPYGVAVNPDGVTAYVTNASDDTVSVIDVATNTVIATIVVGNDPRGVAFSPDGATAYVTNANSGGIGSMSVIDVATNTVTDTFVVGEYPRGVAVSPDGATVYVSNEAGQNVSVIDAATNNVSTFIDVGPVPEAMAVSPDGTRLYVVDISAVSVIDTATNAVVDTIAIGNTAPGIAVSPDGAHVYVTGGTNPGDVSVVDTATNTVIDTITAGATPGGMAVSPDGATGYVANYGSDTVSVIRLALPASLSTDLVAQSNPASSSERTGLWDLLTRISREIQLTIFNRTPTTGYDMAANRQTIDLDGRVTAVNGDLVAFDADDGPLRFTVTQAPGDGSVVVNPDGTFVYTPGRELGVAGGTDQFVVTVADVGFHLHGPLGVFQPNFGHSTTATVDILVDPTCPGSCEVNPVKVVDVGNGPSFVAVSPDGTRAYVVNNLDTTVSVVDTATNTVTATITVGDNPLGVAFRPDGATAYVTNGADDTVSVIDTDTATVTATISVGQGPWGVAVSPDGATAYVTNSAGDTVSVIDTATNTVTTTIPAGDGPGVVAITPDGATVYINNMAGGTVSVLDTATVTITTTIAVGFFPEGLALSPDGATAYVVASTGGETISVIDTATNTVTATIDVGVYTRRVAVSPDGATVYATNASDDMVSVIDTATNTVTATIGVGDSPIGVAVSPDGTRVYVANSFDDSLSVIDVTAASLNMVAAQSVPTVEPAEASVASQVVSAVWDVWVRATQEIRHAFFNATPTLDHRATENSQTVVEGLVTAVNGDLRAADGDEDPLRFTVTEAPQNGSVVINRDGSFVYTPSRELAAAGGTDQFVVKVADVGFHLHGLLAVFKPDFGRTATATVDVLVDPNCPGSCLANIVKVIDTIDVGEAPDGVAISPDGTRVYVANALDNTVSVINTATNTVIATMPVGDTPRDVAVNPAGTRAYVTNLLDGTVSVINTANNSVITTIFVGASAERLAVSPGGGRVYVANSLGFGSSVSVINTATNLVTGSAVASLNGHPYGLAVHPNGGRVFVTTQIDWLDVMNTVTNEVTHVDTDAGWLWGVVLNPLGTRVYYASSGDGTVSVRSTNTNALIATIDVGEDPRGLAISPDGTRVYVLNKEDDTMSVIRTSTNTVLATVDVGNSPNEVVISPDGTRAYVTNSFSDTVTVLQL